jgi:hypothetical protein
MSQKPSCDKKWQTSSSSSLLSKKERKMKDYEIDFIVEKLEEKGWLERG